MNLQDIALQRLTAQHLVGSLFMDAEAAVRHFMCMQSQDYYGAKWAVAQRTKGVTSAHIDELYDAGKILRLHIMRPTWHFVLPEDIRWILKLTSPRAHQVNAYYYRKCELTPEIFAKSNALFKKVLAGNNFKTRTELKDELEAAGISTADLRLTYLLAYAELEGVLCSGSRRGKQHTFALLDERAPAPGRQLEGDEALETFVRRYFAAHGPAQIHDVVWWASLTVAQVKRGIELAGDLHSVEVEGKTYWFMPAAAPKVQSPLVRLLPNYDELTVAFKDHTASTDAARINSAKPSEREFVFYYHVITVDGRAVGGWTIDKKSQVHLRLIGTLSASEVAGVKAEVARMAEFLQAPAALAA
jgi:hypothetical protein